MNPTRLVAATVRVAATVLGVGRALSQREERRAIPSPARDEPSGSATSIEMGRPR